MSAVAACLHDRIAGQAARTPDAPAVVAGEAVLSYAGLAARAGELAGRLRRRGAGPEARVAVLLERTPELVVALLGVLEAGAAFVPLDPAHPRDRLIFQRRDAGARLLVTSSRLADLLPGPPGDVVLAGETCPPLDQEARPGGCLPDHLAYVIYTSGSTGRPKGVMVSHRAALRYLSWAAEAYEVAAGPGAAVHSSVAFDLALTALFTPLLAGRTVFLVPDGPGELAGALQGPCSGGLLKVTPGHLEMLAAALRPEQIARAARTLVVGGEALRGRSLEPWRRAAPGMRIVNEYGPTEAVVGCCAREVPPGEVPAGDVPVGRPVAGARIALAGPGLEPVAAGEPGEILVAGEGLARGYLGRPDLTAERFLPDPFPERPGARAYRTGDLARALPGGDLLFVGRRDDQVKVRGVRVEPGEVEAVLGALPGVREAAVAAVLENDEIRLVAWVAPPRPSGAEELRTALAARLPEPMVPSRFVFLDALPRTPAGKVDRKALPPPPDARPELPVPWAPPRTPLERSLADLWGRLLRIAAPGIDDPFLALGGHSLLAARLAVRAREELGLPVAPRDLFEHPTLRALALALEERPAEKAEEVPFLPLPRDGRPLRATFAQERVWFVERLQPGSRAYHAQSTLRFRGPLAPGLLARCLEALVRRHEVYRTVFEEDEGRPVLRVHSEGQVPLTLVDLTGLPPACQEEALAQAIEEQLAAPFDLARLPLVRWPVLRLDARDHLLLQVEHHMLHDGWSFHLFLGELAELYRALAAGRPPDLPELAVQLADLADWQRRWLASEEARRELAYWERQLAGLPPAPDLPADRPRPATPTHRGAAPREELPLPLCRDLRAFCRREGVTPFVAALAAFFALLERLTGERDLCVGSGFADRRTRAAERVIGMVLNTVALRAGLGGRPSVRGLLARVRDTVLGAYAHQSYPFEKVVEVLAPARDSGRNPFFQTAFSFQDAPAPDLSLPGIEVEVVEALGNGTAKLDLNVILIPRAEQRVGSSVRDGREGITLVWEHSADLFDPETAARMAGWYRTLLAGLVAAPGRPLADLPLLTQAERRELETWSHAREGPGVAPAAPLAWELALAQAGRTPDAVALAGEGTALTYGELAARAEGWACRLRGRGVGPERIVAVRLQPSPEMVVAHLAVWMAGGAFLPLDPEQPAERLDRLLADSGAEVLLAGDSLGSSPTLSLPGSRALPDSRAYVLYTSGSTGRPKGIEVPHAALAARLAWHLAAYGVKPGDRASQVASPAFDASLLEVWPALAAGGRVCFPPAAARGAPAALYRWAAREGIRFLLLPTPLAEAVLAEEPPPGLAVAFLLTGGDRLRRAPASLPFRLVNHYGPTEATIAATCAEVAPGTPGAPLIGRPLAGTVVRLLDREGRPVPAGVPGEVWLGGAGLARGYLGRPDLTAERFRPDPFAGPGGEGSRLYDTGDLARWRPDGQLDFLGRTDHQVKVRGVRIELAEVESALAEHPGVGRAVVVATAGEGETRLVAWIEPGPGGLPAPEDLRAFLRGRLPAAMVPAAFAALPELPLLPGGKVDRLALARREPPPEETGPEAAEPRSPAEALLARIWGEVLGRERVGVHDDFFALGGHSLLAAQVAARVWAALGVDLPLRVFFERPTVAEMGVWLEGALTPE